MTLRILNFVEARVLGCGWGCFPAVAMALGLEVEALVVALEALIKSDSRYIFRLIFFWLF
jgi:hypothetical protein